MKIDKSTKGIFKKVIAALTVLCAITIITFIWVRSHKNSDQATDMPLIETANFNVIEADSDLLTNETININTSGDDWSLMQNSLSFSDQGERDAAAATSRAKAEAAAQAAAKSLALSDQARQSYSYVATAGSPENAPHKSAPEAPGNSYGKGTCTWYAFNRRAQIGRPIPNSLGNGGSWHFSAGSHGLGADHTPEIGAVFEMAGHVGIVEAIGENNSVYISEMNYGYTPYLYNERWVPNASSYWYIH